MSSLTRPAPRIPTFPAIRNGSDAASAVIATAGSAGTSDPAAPFDLGQR